jgi:hypothetical protein
MRWPALGPPSCAQVPPSPLYPVYWNQDFSVEFLAKS